MKKEEISQKICDVYNMMSALTITGYDNAKILVDCMDILKNILPELLNLNVVEEIKGEVLEDKE